MLNFNPFKKTEEINSVKEQVKRASKEKLPRETLERYFELTKKEDGASTLSMSEQKELIMLRSKVERATVSSKTEEGFGKILEELGFSDEEIKELVLHEGAHARKAKELGARLEQFRIIVLDAPEDQYSTFIDTLIAIPEEDAGWSKERQDEVSRQIAMAPELAGGELSEGDKNHIRDLDKTYD